MQGGSTSGGTLHNTPWEGLSVRIVQIHGSSETIDVLLVLPVTHLKSDYCVRRIFSKPGTASQMGEFLSPRNDVEIGKITNARLEVVRGSIRFGGIECTSPPPSTADQEVALLRSCRAAVRCLPPGAKG